MTNYQHLVEEAAATWPEDWKNAHTDLGSERSRAFIRKLAAFIHTIDPRVGLNGKRGDPHNISDDALAVFDPNGDVIDRAGRRMFVVDVIAGAGGPDPRPAWQSVGSGGHPGAWVQPETVSVPTPQPTPQPTPTPPAIDYSARLEAIQSSQVFLINQIAQLRNDVKQQQAQTDTAVAKLNALGLEVVDVRNALSNGLGITADGVARTVLGTVKIGIAGVAKG
jgi:hypothetical protein